MLNLTWQLLKYITIIILLLPVLLYSQKTYGEIEGKIIDKTLSPIVNVSAVLTGANLQGSKTVYTSAEGKFAFYLVPAGNYKLSVEHGSYDKVTYDNVSVRIGKSTYIGNIVLEDKSYRLDEVTVTFNKPVIDFGSSASGQNINKRFYGELPVGRNYQSAAALIPSANISYYGDGINIAGSTGLENVYYVDGNNITDPVDAATSINLPYNFVKEIEVISGGYQAEYGRSLGGIINVITPSGSNNFEANIFSFYTNNELGGIGKTGIQNASITHFSDYDFGGSLSGPIIKDKLWFFAAYNPKFEEKTYNIKNLGQISSKVTSHLFAAKFTWQATTNTSVKLNFMGDPTIRHDVDEITDGIISNKDLLLQKREMGGINSSLQLTHVFTTNVFLEAGVSYLSQKETGVPETEIGKTESAILDIPNGTVSGGRGYIQNDSYSRLSVNTSATFLTGDHVMKGGVEFENNSYNLELRNNFQNSLLFKLDESLFISSYIDYTGSVKNKILTAYIQDSWNITERLTLNLGIRLDAQFFFNNNGENVQSITDQFQPRAGIIYQPFETGTQKVTASFGRFYEQIPSRFVGFNYIDRTDYSIMFTEDPRNSNVQGDTTNFSSAASGEIIGLKGEYYDEYTLGYEQYLFENYTISVRGIYRTIGEVVDDFIDLSQGKYIVGNPGKGDINFIPELTREYQALEFSIQKVTGKNFNFSASYVLSKNYGNYTGIFNQDIGDFLPNANQIPDIPDQVKNSKGLLPNDRTHVFKLAGFYKFDFGLTAGMNFIYMSGTPLSEFGVDPYGILLPVFISKRGTAGRTPSIVDIDLRFKYNLAALTGWNNKFNFIFDINHLLNSRTALLKEQQHYLEVDQEGNPSNPNQSYGNTTKYLAPRTFRIGMEIDL